jgi:predicted PurR-regulated permease PerM
MVISLYYFLADGPGMIRTALDLSPLDSQYEQELLARFGQVSRAVVVATLLSALVQGSLAGFGYYFALPGGAPIFLLTAATMVTAMVPFVGAAAVWIPVCVWVLLQGPREVDGVMQTGDWVTFVILAVYSTIVVSGIDNLIKPFVLQGQSNLHPLLALLSILGGVQVLGPVGILVGPMLVSFLQALLEMLRKELDSFSEPEQSVVEVLAGTPVPPAGALAAPGDSPPAVSAPRPPQAKPKTGRFRRRKT